MEEGLTALANGGPDAVRVEKLAEALGVTKGGFYGYFDDRKAFLEEMLERWEHAVIDEVVERVDGEGGDARSKLERLFGLASSPEAARLVKIELAVRDWARRDESVARRLRRVDNRRMDYMRPLFGELCADEEEVEARCLLVGSLWIGNQLFTADHGPRRRGEVLARAVQLLLTC